MVTRFDKKGQSRFGVPPLPSGYDGDTSSTLNVPSVGIEDVDRALFELFDKKIPFVIEGKDGTRKVPIIFTSGEKWATLKRGAPRDKNGSLIIPIIVIGRTNIVQSPSEDIAGRGINQQTGEIVIRRRLDPTNRDYQNIINKSLLQNQENVAVQTQTVDGQITTSREVGTLSDDPTVSQGGLLVSNKTKTIWETITLPSPQFFTATYEVIIWAQYIQQMNMLVEQLMSSFLPQGNQWRIDTPKGYWFVGTVDGNSYTAQNNFDDMSRDERMIQYHFSIKVPAYILASKAPGLPVPVRRYVSNPDISFAITNDGSETLGVDDPYLGSDDPTLPHTDSRSNRTDQRRTNGTRLYSTDQHDPAYHNLGRAKKSRYSTIKGLDSKGNVITRHVKVKSINTSTGETVYSQSDLSGISILIDD